MTASPLHSVVRCLSRLPAELSDAELLDRFRRGGEDAAFALLVQRHGPAVLGVCRRLLGNAADVDDAFQATFLVLLRGASTVRRGSALGCWLYGVACRVAAKARARRTPSPLPGDTFTAPGFDPAGEAAFPRVGCPARRGSSAVARKTPHCAHPLRAGRQDVRAGSTGAGLAQEHGRPPTDAGTGNPSPTTGVAGRGRAGGVAVGGAGEAGRRVLCARSVDAGDGPARAAGRGGSSCRRPGGCPGGGGHEAGVCALGGRGGSGGGIGAGRRDGCLPAGEGSAGRAVRPGRRGGLAGTARGPRGIPAPGRGGGAGRLGALSPRATVVEPRLLARRLPARLVGRGPAAGLG
jgi:hypothetical protein